MFKLKKVFLLLLCNLIFCVGYSQSPPQIVVTGEQLYCGDSPMSIVTSISISDGDGVLDEVYVQISTGYASGNDQLFLDGVHPAISASWSPQEGQLILTGPATYAEFENAIINVKYQTTQTNFTQDKFFSINLGNANFLPATGHYYYYVADTGISWSDAKTAAAEETYFGLQGYLATITTPEEVQLTGEQAQGTGWIGGSDRSAEGIWRWETGPEEGQIFWEGLANGSAPDNMFSFWNTGEPNSFGDEDYAHITDPSIGVLGSWNDLPLNGETDPSSPYHPKGFIVEFGGMPGDPDINVSASTIITTPKLNIVTDSACDEGIVQIAIDTNTDEVLWFETPSSTEVLNSGFTYETFIDTTSTFWLLATFSGCEGGGRIPVTVDVFTSPITNDISIIQCDDEVADGLSTFNLNNYRNDIIVAPNGTIDPSLQVSFFEDELLQNGINGDSYMNTSNNQTIYARVFDSATGCVSVSEVLLQVNIPSNLVVSIEACDDFDIDGYTFFDLSEASSQLLNNFPINSAIRYYVTYSDALLEENVIAGEYFNEVPYSQVIYARVDDDNSCYGINEVMLTVKDLPNIAQYEEVYYCLNNFPEPLALDGGVINDIPNNYAYEWSTGETTISIDINEVGTYEVLVTRPLGCTNRRTIVVKPSNTATFETIEVTDLTENNTITVLVSGEGDYVYALDNENGIYQESNIFENVSTGIHTVYVRDVKADCGVVSEAISVLGFPKFFTPNGDTVNDTWKIKGFSSQFPVTANVKVFNRYGKLIARLNSDNPEWDGTYDGQLLNTDDYWFVAELTDGRNFKGHFTLKR